MTRDFFRQVWSLVLGEKRPQSNAGHPRWEYQWQFGDSVRQSVTEPPLEIALVQEIVAACKEQTNDRFVVSVRGELGIGKSTLVGLLRKEIEERIGTLSPRDAHAISILRTARIIEAEDLEAVEEFSLRLKQATTKTSVVVMLGRPITINIVCRLSGITPYKTVDMLPFEPGKQLFFECISQVARNIGRSEKSFVSELTNLVGGFNDKILQTPFYFEQAALLLKDEPDVAKQKLTPFEIFQKSLQRRLASLGVSLPILVDCALGKADPDRLPKLAGIISETGFVHDGYRNVLLASAVLTRGEKFETMIRAANILPAIEIICSHIRGARSTRRDTLDAQVLTNLRDFVIDPPKMEQKHFPIYIQAKLAHAFRQIGDSKPAERLRERCMELIAQRAKGLSIGDDEGACLWDISDALTLVQDPRLRKAASQSFGRDSGYFVLCQQMEVLIGSKLIPERSDKAKPVLPYYQGAVTVGPLWVSRFLVSNDLFLEFWAHPDRNSFFTGTGAQWIAKDADLRLSIEETFDLSARRNFWKELKEKDSIKLSSVDANGPTPSPLELARRRALEPSAAAEELPDLVPLWFYERFGGSGKPVVGVNWWEAVAFCNWWTRTKLPNSGFPRGSHASLLTDWEWEALRRRFYEPDGQEDRARYEPNRYPAHTRSSLSTTPNGRVHNAMCPLHIGLSLSPLAPDEGPTDMVGNVWEWTRSKVVGRIVGIESASIEFGPTIWDDVDPVLERTPGHERQDEITGTFDLSYRAVRGGSFFSRDDQAAWHPAYRLCDPPFSSYIDLGFRIAIYPPSSGETTK